MGAGGRAGPQAESCAPQNERENTSYDVATLQDEEGELPEFPGETPPAFPLPTSTPHHVWGPRGDPGGHGGSLGESWHHWILSSHL